MGWFSNTGEAMDIMRRAEQNALNQMTMPAIEGASREILPYLMQAAEQMRRYETLAATMGAAGASAEARRLFGPGSGMGDVSRGLQLGAGFGPASTLTYQAIRDSLNFGAGNQYQRANTMMQAGATQSQLKAMQPSAFQNAMQLAGVAGNFALAFGGNPISQAGAQSTTPRGAIGEGFFQQLPEGHVADRFDPNNWQLPPAPGMPYA